MHKYKEVIFVCKDNTCLSPLAEAVLKKEQRKIGIDNVAVKSRGIVVLFSEPVNKKMAEVAKEDNINILNHHSEELNDKDFGEDVLVLVMGAGIKQKIYKKYKSAINVYTVKEFVGEQGDVKVPFGGEESDYEETFMLLNRLIINTMNKLYGENENDSNR